MSQNDGMKPAAPHDMRRKQAKARLIAVQDNKKEGEAFLAENKTKEGVVGDTESGPKSDILGQPSAGIRTDHCLEFPA